MKVDLDPEVLGTIAQAAADAADYETVNDYGYGGDTYETREVGNWIGVVQAVVALLPEPTAEPVLAGSPEQRCRDAITVAFAHATSVHARSGHEVMVLAAVEESLAKAVRMLDECWSPGS